MLKKDGNCPPDCKGDGQKKGTCDIKGSPFCIFVQAHHSDKAAGAERQKAA